MLNSENFRKNLKLLNVALILGVVLGSLFAALHFYKNQYLNYEVYNIVLLDLQTYVTDYVLILIFIALSLITLDRLIVRVFQIGRLKRFQERNSGKKIPEALSYSLIIVIILALICYSVYPDIIAFLKSTSLAESLEKLSKSRNETFIIFFLIFSLLGLLFVIFSTYVLSRFNLANKIQQRFLDITDSRSAVALGSALLGMVLILNLFMFGYKRIGSPEGTNVIVISIDTLRADHLGSYGYERPTSPNIDKLADKGIVFENAYSQGSWTYPSMASMHTSLYPSQVGIKGIEDKIHDSFMTLAEHMKNNFYNTYAVISNVVVSEPLGFAQGFDTFNQDSITEYDETSSHLVTDRAIKYLTETKGEKFFLWLHYMDPHGTYIHHPEYGYSSNYSGFPEGLIVQPFKLNDITDSIDDEGLMYVIDLYDEEISYTDKHIGRVLDYLSELKLSDNTIVIITADHGEEFMERGKFGHGRSLYQELIHVPLIIYIPSDKELGAKRVKSTVEVRSIARTVLDLSGIKNTQFRGKNLLITAEDEESGNYAFSQHPNKEGVYPGQETIITDNWKLINNLTLSTYELYNIENDPGEKINLFESTENGSDGVKKELISKLSGINTKRVGVAEVEEVEFKEEDIKRLKALGYIE